MTERARTRFRGPVLDCADAVELARFYAALLDWTVRDEAAGEDGSWAFVISPGGDLKIELQGAPDYVPPVWPTVAGEQQMMMHLDVIVEVMADPDPRARFGEVVAHAESLGARRADHQPRPDHFTVMVDPAGHPFCLVPG